MTIEIKGLKAWFVVFLAMIGAIDLFILTPAVALITLNSLH